MKNLLIYLALTILSQSTFAGPRTIGNGGDGYSLQFVTSAQTVLSYLQKYQFEGIDTNALAKTIDSAKVESTDEDLKLNGMNKDAINYPSENRIVFNRARWNSLAGKERLALVLHEYLGLLGTDDTNYQLSKLVLRDMTHIGDSQGAVQGKYITCESVPGSASKVQIEILTDAFLTTAYSGPASVAMTITAKKTLKVTTDQAVYMKLENNLGNPLIMVPLNNGKEQILIIFGDAQGTIADVQHVSAGDEYTSIAKVNCK